MRRAHRKGNEMSKNTEISKQEMLSILQDWADTRNELHKQCDAFLDLTAAAVDSKMMDSIYRMAGNYTAAVAKSIGDNTGMLEWFEWDNEMGRRGLCVSIANGREREIKTLKDLAWAIRG